MKIKKKRDVEPIEALKGIYRRTLAYNKNLMLCFFKLEKDAEVPMHQHKEHQVGYIIKGKIRFVTEGGEFILTDGDSYLFDSDEKHGAFILEEAELIDIFNPARDDYK